MTKNWGVKIEIGNDAPRSDDWITVNLDENVKPTIKAPATEIPLEDESADLIYASHILEHLNYGSRHPSVHAALQEWARILKPGGTLMVAVPDLEVLCDLYLNGDSTDRVMVMRMMLGGHMNEFDYHYAGFDEELLASYLAYAGFGEIKRVKDFGLFRRDCSTLEYKYRPISLNMKATKNV